MFRSQLPSVDAGAVPADAILLDVREDEEWAAGHAEGALHIPMSEIVARVDEVPDGGTVHVVCRVGGRSAQVTQFLLGQGRDAVNVSGGMLDWAAAGRQVVTGDGAPGHVL